MTNYNLKNLINDPNEEDEGPHIESLPFFSNFVFIIIFDNGLDNPRDICHFCVSLALDSPAIKSIAIAHKQWIKTNSSLWKLNEVSIVVHLTDVSNVRFMV